MPFIRIHQEKAVDKTALAAICLFKAIEEKNGQLEINDGCRMCRMCILGGSVALYGGIMIVLTGMNRFLELDEENMTLTLEPGYF